MASRRYGETSDAQMVEGISAGNTGGMMNDKLQKDMHKDKRGRTYPLARLPNIRTQRVLSRGTECQVTQLVALVEHLVAYCEINDSGQHNAHPDWYVVCEDAQGVPAVTYPAPQLLSSSCQNTELLLGNCRMGHCILTPRH